MDQCSLHRRSSDPARRHSSYAPKTLLIRRYFIIFVTVNRCTMYSPTATSPVVALVCPSVRSARHEIALNRLCRAT